MDKKGRRLADALTSRISAIQPGGGVARAAMGAALTAETAARATRARESNLDMSKERKEWRVGGSETPKGRSVQRIRWTSTRDTEGSLNLPSLPFISFRPRLCFAERAISASDRSRYLDPRSDLDLTSTTTDRMCTFAAKKIVPFLNQPLSTLYREPVRLLPLSRRKPVR